MLKLTVKIFLIAGSILLAFTEGCNYIDRSDDAVNDTTKFTATDVSIQPDTIYAGNRDTVILLKNEEAFIKGHINKNQLKYTLPAWKGQTVTAILVPLKKGGNVRINQIQKPGGTFDGPFGDSIQYPIKTNGNYRFVIGENLMAGRPFTGDFVLHIIVK